MTLRLPFVKYFLIKENNYVFPSKQVEMRNMIDSISRNTDNNIDSIFYNQIEELYQSVTNTNLVKEKYRGFLVKSLKDFKINGNHYDNRTKAAAEEKLFQLAK